MIQPLIIGHRGASAVAPENTMAAFRAAITAGADGIEFDVRLTRDGIPVVIHDRTLRRTGGRSERVADLTWPEVEHVNVASWFASKKKLPPASFTNETVPSLQELFELYKSNHLLLYLEMKCDSPSEYEPLAKACCKLIEEHLMKERVIVECFQLAALNVIRNIDPHIKTAALFEPALTKPSVLSDQRILDQAAAVGASELALHHRLARRRLVQKAKVAGLRVVVWTVDDPAWIERARAIGVDALITNDPAAMLAHR
jgi:glycerophosphoryl diester phosphodiesterase